MATQVYPLRGDIKGLRSRTGREYTEAYIVLFDADTYNPDTAADASDGVSGYSIPDIGDAYSGYATATCSKIDPEPTDSAKCWKVFVEYKTPTNGKIIHGNPTLDDPEIDISTAFEEVVAEKDKDGDAIVNSAEDPFDPPLMKKRKIRIITISENLSSYDDDTHQAYIDTINNGSETVAGKTIAAYKGKIEDISCRNASRNSYDYYIRTVKIAVWCDPQGDWRRSVLDQGANRLVSGVSKRCIVEGKQVTRPVLLDGSGGQLAKGGTPQFLSFEIESYTSWSGLSLPSTF